MRIIWLIGINGDDDRCLFFECAGANLINSTAIGKIFMNGNTVETAVGVRNARYKVAGTFSFSADAQRFAFDAVNNALEYTSAVPRVFFINMPFTARSAVSTNIIIGTYIGVKRFENENFNPDVDRLDDSELYITSSSSSRPDSGTCVDIVTLRKGDKLYAITQNRSGTQSLVYEALSIIPVKAN